MKELKEGNTNYELFIFLLKIKKITFFGEVGKKQHVV